MIDKAGLHLNVDVNEYHADPCPEPSFSHSIGKLIIERSPLHAWYAHPRLNPDFVQNDDTKFDLGNCAHALLIGRGKEVVRIDAPDWRTKAAQMSRDEAIAAGKMPVLNSQYARAEAMVKAARAQLEMYDGLGELFLKGDGEVVSAWQEGGLWCRQLIDWLNPERTIFADYKTTGKSAAAHSLDLMMVQAAWPMQAAMAERGVVVNFERNAFDRFLFIVQETTLPYALNVVEIGESAMTMGRKQIDAAFRVWADCMKRNVWPSYPRKVVCPEYPGFAETRWLEREEREFGGDPQDLIMAG